MNIKPVSEWRRSWRWLSLVVAALTALVLAGAWAWNSWGKAAEGAAVSADKVPALIEEYAKQQEAFMESNKALQKLIDERQLIRDKLGTERGNRGP